MKNVIVLLCSSLDCPRQPDVGCGWAFVGQDGLPLVPGGRCCVVQYVIGAVRQRVPFIVIGRPQLYMPSDERLLGRPAAHVVEELAVQFSLLLVGGQEISQA